MNAAQPQAIPPAPPAPGGAIPPAAHDPNLQLQRELEDNSLYNWLRSVPDKLKSARISNPKILGGLLLLVLAGGIWWWFSGETKKAEAGRWKELNGATTPAELAKIAKDNPDSTQALIARREEAENLFGTEGTAKLNSGDTRPAAIESVEKARKEFLELAEEFKKADDRTLRAKCLRQAAEAEESLIGIPKAGVTSLDWDESQDRGTVARAVELYTEAAKTIGEKSAAGERFTALATQLTATANRKPDERIFTPHLLGKYLHKEIVARAAEPGPKAPDKLLPVEAPGGTAPPPVAPDKTLPVVPPTGTEPKTPDKPLDPAAPPPTGTGAAPKAPEKPLIPTPSTGK